MDQSLDLASVLRLYRDAIAVAAHGNDGILQNACAKTPFTSPDRVACTLSLIWPMERRMCLSAGLASSLISSSSRMHRRISADKGATGSNLLEQRIQAVLGLIAGLVPSIRFDASAVSSNLQMRSNSPLQERRPPPDASESLPPDCIH